MPNDNNSEVTGVIKSIYKDPVYGSTDNYHVEFTILDEFSRLLPVRYSYPSRYLAESVIGSLRPNLKVKLALHGQVNNTAVYYRGLGPIVFADTAPETQAAGFDFGSPSAGEDETFTSVERLKLKAALDQAKSEIREQFNPSDTQMHQVEARLDDLSLQVDKASKASWSKLFVACVVGVSVDLGCGSTVPETLIRLFKTVLAGVLTQKLLSNSSPKRG